MTAKMDSIQAKDLLAIKKGFPGSVESQDIEVKQSCFKHYKDIFDNLRKAPDLIIHLQNENFSKHVMVNKCVLEAFQPGMVLKLYSMKKDNSEREMDSSENLELDVNSFGFFIRDFVNMIDYIYSGVVTLLLFNVSRMMCLAAHFKVHKLMAKIGSYIRSVLNNGNCVKLFLVLCKNDDAVDMNDDLTRIKKALNGYIRLYKCYMVKECEIYKYSVEDIIYLLQHNCLSELKDMETACEFAKQMLDSCQCPQNSDRSSEEYDSDLNAAKAAKLAISFMLEGYEDFLNVHQNELLRQKVLFLNLIAKEKLGISEYFIKSLKNSSQEKICQSLESKTHAPTGITDLESDNPQTFNEETKYTNMSLDAIGPHKTCDISSKDKQAYQSSFSGNVNTVEGSVKELRKIPDKNNPLYPDIVADRTRDIHASSKEKEESIDKIVAFVNNIKEEPGVFPTQDKASTNTSQLNGEEVVESFSPGKCVNSLEIGSKVSEIKIENVDGFAVDAMVQPSSGCENNNAISGSFLALGNDRDKDSVICDIKHEATDFVEFPCSDSERLRQLAAYVANDMLKSKNTPGTRHSLLKSQSILKQNKCANISTSFTNRIAPMGVTNHIPEKRKIMLIHQKTNKRLMLVQKGKKLNFRQHANSLIGEEGSQNNGIHQLDNNVAKDEEKVSQCSYNITDLKSRTNESNKTEKSSPCAMFLPKCGIIKVVKNPKLKRMMPK